MLELLNSLLILSHAATAYDAYNAASAQLVHQAVHYAPADSEKKIDMTFDETRRDPDKSFVEVVHQAGRPAAASMFILKGMCAVARARGERFFQPVELSTDPIRFEVTFPKNPEPADLRTDDGKHGKVFAMTECEMLSY